MAAAGAHARDYNGAITALNSLQTNAKALAEQKRTGGRNLKKSLEEVRSYAKRMDISTEDLTALRAIHVAGSKGKGSTCAISAAIMQKAGHKTGLYTSPHLIEARERIRINMKPLSQKTFARYFWMCWDLLEANPGQPVAGMPEMPTYFRFLTLMAFKVSWVQLVLT